MDRRSFLRISGSIAATGVVGSCGQMTQKIIPYVNPPDEGINPVDGTYFNTTCRMCNAGCGIKVRTVMGRAKKVEGNPSHPINRGGVCARGQAAVQELYHPERLQSPLIRNGAKGTNSFKPVSWDEALDLLAKRLKEAGPDMCLVTDDAADIAAAIGGRLMSRIGSPHFAVPEIHGWTNYAASAPFLTPVYDLKKAGCVLLLGADIFEDGLAPVHYGWAFGQMRRGGTRRGRVLYAGPRVSLTASSADRFISVEKGMLGVFTLGVAAKVLASAGGPKALTGVSPPAAAAWRAALEPYTPERVSRLTGCKTKTIDEVADDLVKCGPSAAIPGDELFLHSNGAGALEAVQLLNGILRAVSGGETIACSMSEAGAVPYRKMKDFIGVQNKTLEYAALTEIVSHARAGRMKLGIIIGANPVHELPAALNMTGALEKTGFIAVIGCFLNDTTRYADLVLPDNHFLETWSAQQPAFVPGVPVLNLQQPVVAPLYATLAAGDILIKAAARAGKDLGIKSQEALIQSMLEKFGKDMNGLPSGLEGKGAWEFLLQRGGWWPEERAVSAPKNTNAVSGKVLLDDPEFAGGKEYGFHLHPYHTVNIGAGRGANLGWLMEMPEPMTSISWGAWIEINPVTAAGLGIVDGDILKVSSPFGSVMAVAYLYPGIGPSTVAIPFGYGHGSFGKNATGRGANAMDLIGEFPVKGRGIPAWRGIKVKLEKTGKRAELVREGNPKGDYEGEVFQL